MRPNSAESAVLHSAPPVSATPVVPPIYQTSSFVADSTEAFFSAATTPLTRSFYTRYGNPTQDLAAQMIANLEGAAAALVFSSGVGAMATTALSLLQQGDHVVAQDIVYTGTSGLLRELLLRFGVTASFVDQRDAAAFAAAVRRNTKAFFLETPSNPTLTLTDLEAIAEVAREHRIITICDNTIATPIVQRPLDYGIDVVIHSATKAMGGHGDIVAGAVASSAELVERIWRSSLVIGATLGPIDAWLLARGLRTLPLRVHRLNSNARELAFYLARHEKVRRVNYPGLPSHPQHQLAKRQMKNGFGGLLSFELDADRAGTERFLRGLKNVKLAPSIGHVESLIMYPVAAWSLHDTSKVLEDVGIGDSLLRLSVGIEHFDDLVADVDDALERV